MYVEKAGWVINQVKSPQGCGCVFVSFFCGLVELIDS